MRRAAVIVVQALGAAAAVLLLGGAVLARLGDLSGAYPGHELMVAWARAGRSPNWIRTVVDVSVAVLLLGGVTWYVIDTFGVFRSREDEGREED
jgi:uncharacterized membrane protein YczE